MEQVWPGQHRRVERELLDRVAHLLPAALAFLDQQNLRRTVNVPVGARARLEADARHVHPGRLLHGNRAGEVVGEVPASARGRRGTLPTLSVLLALLLRSGRDHREGGQCQRKRETIPERPLDLHRTSLAVTSTCFSIARSTGRSTAPAGLPLALNR